MKHLPARVWPLWLSRHNAHSGRQILMPTTTQMSIPKQPFRVLLYPATYPSFPSRSTNSTPNRFFKSRPKSQCLKKSQQFPKFVNARAFQPNQVVRTFSNSSTSPPPVTVTNPPTGRPTWSPPTDIRHRPVAIIGAGVLGRRLAMIWASRGLSVNLYDESKSALTSSTVYIADTLSSYCSSFGTHPGHVHFTTCLVDALSNSWMVIEAVPEDLELKISMLGRLDRTASRDAIIATNSSSFTSRELVSEVKNRERVLNTLYYIPPQNKFVELMSCGYTAPAVFSFLVHQMRNIGLRPVVVGDESTGMIFPRIWGAMKRETLKVLQEGVAKPGEVDELFKDFFGSQRGICEKMDEIGLDTVATVERHFLDRKEFEGKGEGRDHLQWLEREFVKRGKLGDKSGEGLLLNKEEEQVKRDTPGQEVWKEHSVDLSGL